MICSLSARSLKRGTDLNRRIPLGTGFGLQTVWIRSDAYARARSGAQLMWKKKGVRLLFKDFPFRLLGNKSPALPLVFEVAICDLKASTSSNVG